MKVGHSIAKLQNEHVEYELECIDRMYLNLYIPGLQAPEMVAWFIKNQLGMRFASSAVLAPIGQRFIHDIKDFCQDREIDLYQS